MAYNFNKDPEALAVDVPGQDDDRARGSSESPPSTGETPSQPESPAFTRFRSCRWHQPKEAGNAEFCTHREVKPYAGTAGFDADAWCPDCQYYKLRRSPKKKQPGDDYSY